MPEYYEFLHQSLNSVHNLVTAINSLIQKIHKAISLEEEAQFTDLIGLKEAFSKFMQSSLRILQTDHQLSIAGELRKQYELYHCMNMFDRMNLLKRTKKVFHDLEEDLEIDTQLNTKVNLGNALSKAKHDSSQLKDGTNGKNNPPPSTSIHTSAEEEKIYILQNQANKEKNELSKVQNNSLSKKTVSVKVNTIACNAELKTNKEKFIESLETDIKWIPGVGERLAIVLNKLGVFTVADILAHWPRQHLNFKERLPIRDLKVGAEATIVGLISKVNAFQSPRNPNLSILNAKVTDSTGSISLNRFVAGKSNKFLLEQYKKQFPLDSLVMVSGRVQADRSTRYQLSNFSLQVIDEDGNTAKESLEVGRMVPVYALTEGLHQSRLRKIIFNALEKFEDKIEETLPSELINEFKLISLKEATRQMHFPTDEESLELAKRRIIFEEFFSLQLPLAIKYQQNQQEKIGDTAREIKLSEEGPINSLLKLLPFELTGAQKRVFHEIMRDLGKDSPMNRLIQGDVGSGKTIVALLTMLVAVERGEQAAMMAPTEILAEQHFRKFQEFLSQIGIKVALLVGSQRAAERREILTGLANGQIQIVVGTHALIQERVEFANLGLVVVDEQHRFGVRQRDQLRRKGGEKLADCLFMTATPIPRTLALATYGNLDLSEIDELPPGRKPIKTKIVAGANRSKAHEFVKKQLVTGRQAYIVYPLIEESESLSAKAVTVEASKLQKNYAEYKVGVIHGKLAPDEKDQVMSEFRKGEIHVLVGTTVIEVGVDVPNSTIMIIENAERFGLAQLHQLRGRVGRGSEQSYCFLFADSKAENTIERLKIMEETENGFIIAQKDLEIRGPGELMGTRQSGLSDFGLASMATNGELLEQARDAARKLVMEDPELKHLPEPLKRKINSLKQKAQLIESA